MNIIINHAQARSYCLLSDLMHALAPRRFACAVLGLLLLANTAQAGVYGIQFDAEQRYQMKELIAAGGNLEVCGDFQKGESILWHYEADRALDFNIHFHVGKKVSFPSRLKQKQEANGKLKTKLSQTYCWMWTNTNQEAASLKLKMSQDKKLQK